LPGFARAAALAAPALVIRVVDGDTIDAVVPPSHQLLRYRLIGFDTPETYYAQCDDERSLGYRAASRLEQLVQDAGVQMDVQRSSKDRYGRGLAKLSVDGQDVAHILIGEGLAVAYDGRGQRINWCAELATR
jgi:endonuclease YncB( thermonuclease family)